MPSDLYYKAHTEVINHILANPNASIFVICDVDDDNHIYGFCATERIGNVPILHYIYIKYSYRKFGLACKLLTTAIPETQDKNAFLMCSHANHNFKRFRSQLNLIFNPYVLKNR